MNADKPLEPLTYSAIKMFRNCRRMFDMRYNRGLVPLEEDDALSLGATVHGGLERWYKRNSGADREQVLAGILEFIDQAFPDWQQDDRQRKNRHLAQAMFLAYVRKYPEEEFEVVAVEQEFRAPIINPDTQCASRTFLMRGKVDAIVIYDGCYFIMEHKTASVIDGRYIERLPMDFQVSLYSDYVGRDMNIRISGVIYNVIGKAMIKQGKGETGEVFETRLDKLIAKSKSGKSSAKQRMPESDEEFQQRLADKYRKDSMFHREQLYFFDDHFENLHSEVWELTQQILLARRTGKWYQNTDHCFYYTKACPYYLICRSGGNPNTIENRYRVAPPHSELEQSDPAQAPVF